MMRCYDGNGEGGERGEGGGKGVDKGLAKCADDKNGAWCTGQEGGLCLPASLGLAVLCSERGVVGERWSRQTSLDSG